MAKNKKSKILAMALCASVMAGIYASPVMAKEFPLDSNSSVTTETTISTGGYTQNEVRVNISDGISSDTIGTFYSNEEEAGFKTDYTMTASTFTLEARGRTWASLTVDGLTYTNQTTLNNVRLTADGLTFSTLRNPEDAAVLNAAAINSWKEKTQNIKKTEAGKTYFDGKVIADKFGTYTDGFYVDENGELKSNKIIVHKGEFTVDRNGAVKAANGAFTVDKDGSVTTKGTLSGAGLVAEGATGGLYVRDVDDGKTMIYTKAADADGTNTVWIDPENGNISTIGTVGVTDDLESGKLITQIQGSGENIGDIAVGIQYDGEGNITGQNIVLDASTGDIIAKGTLSGTGLAAEGADGGLYVQDIGGETMIFAGPKGESSTLRIDPTNGNFMTKGTMSVADENWNPITQIEGSGENIGDIAVGIKADGTQMIHLDASTGSITAANFNGVTLATNDDQVLVGGYDISQMDETLGTVGGDVSQLRTDVNDLRLDVGGLRTDVRILRDDVGGLRTDVNTINSNLEALTDRVQNVEDKTQGISYDKDTGTTTIDGNLDVKGDTETGAGGNENVKGDITAGGDITAEGDVNGTNGNFDKVTTGEISADKGNIGNSHFDENGITVGAAGGQHTTITDTTVDATNGYFDNLQADKADIGGVGLEGGTVTADKVVTGNTTLDNEGLNVGGQTSVTADGVNVGGNGGTTVSKDGVSIADKTIISDHDVVINEGTADRVSLSETADRVGNLEQGVSELNNRVGELEDRIDKVGAMAAAIANLRPMGYAPAAPTEVAVGIGQYRDETGAALGLFHYPNRDFMLSLSVSTSGDEVMGGIGATWKFGRKSPEKVAEIKKAQAEADARRAEEAKLAKAEEMKQAAKEAKIKAQQERHAKLAAERAAQAEAAK